jgi:adenylylsulfate reductase subunit B
MQAGKAVMKYPRDCWGCASCVKECPAEAIAFFLGADIGGSGSTMTVSESGDVLHWKIHCWDGTVKVIDVDRKNANQY